jgi:uracil-DNA glycosylase
MGSRHESWRALDEEFDDDYIDRLDRFLACEAAHGRGFYPAAPEIFKAFEADRTNVKVIVLGQDPYHDGKATGLAFAMRRDSPRDSLKTIFRRIEEDWGPPKATPDLEHWVSEGVLLLNTVLTVAQGLAGSHRGLGWDRFTREALGYVSDRVFLAWGRDAVREAEAVGAPRLLRSAHPRAPRSARLPPFTACDHFSRVNRRYKLGIDW